MFTLPYVSSRLNQRGILGLTNLLHLRLLFFLSQFPAGISHKRLDPPFSSAIHHRKCKFDMLVTSRLSLKERARETSKVFSDV